MTTKVVKTATGMRMITGKLSPYLELDWAAYSLPELKILLKQVVRFEVEHNHHRHKDYKDRVGANIEVYLQGAELKVMSLQDELLVIKEGDFTREVG